MFQWAMDDVVCSRGQWMIMYVPEDSGQWGMLQVIVDDDPDCGMFYPIVDDDPSRGYLPEMLI